MKYFRKLFLPVITKQPESIIYVKGKPITYQLKIETEKSQWFTEDTLYQWYKNTENNSENGTLIPGATKDSYIPPIPDDGTMYYYCKVKTKDWKIGLTRFIVRKSALMLQL